jgi:hypothetical protein
MSKSLFDFMNDESKSASAVVKVLKENNQDFEWYPTTDEIIEVVANDMNSHKKTFDEDIHTFKSSSLLDIGAGDGRVLKALKEKVSMLDDLYFVEKSSIFYNKLSNIALPMGTDFYNTTIIDKEVGFIFCNPPYSEYELWAEKIIRDAYANIAYLVIPQRWKRSKAIKDAILYRDASVKVIGSFDFSNADREARAKVDIVRIKFYKRYARGGYYKGSYHYSKKDPFETLFDTEFKQAEPIELIDEQEEAEIFNKDELVNGNDLVVRLEKLYLRDLDKTIEAYKKITQIPKNLLEEMEIERKFVLKKLKSKLKSLKFKYWQMLFDNLDSINSRLISSSRDELARLLNGRASIDFSASNAYAVIIWAINQANDFINSQTVNMWERLFSADAVRLYKSTARMAEDNWRYLKDDYLSRYTIREKMKKYNPKYYLDYRVVYYGCNAIAGTDSYKWDYENNLHKDAHNFLNDLCTVAKTLGFNVSNNSYNFCWESRKTFRFYYESNYKTKPLKKGTMTNLGKIKDIFYSNVDNYTQYYINGEWYHENLVKAVDNVFMEVRAYVNGNLHIKFNQEFMKKFNVLVAKLKGWIKTPQEAVEEIEGITLEEAKEVLETKITIPTDLKEIPRLLSA